MYWIQTFQQRNKRKYKVKTDEFEVKTEMYVVKMPSKSKLFLINLKHWHKPPGCLQRNSQSLSHGEYHFQQTIFITMVLIHLLYKYVNDE